MAEKSEKIYQMIRHSATGCSISLIDFYHVTRDLQHRFKVKRLKVKVTEWRNVGETVLNHLLS